MPSRLAMFVTVAVIFACGIGVWSCQGHSGTDGDDGGTPPTPPAGGAEVDRKRELMITDLSVVEDARATAPGGVWTFGHLMRELSGPPIDGSNPAEITARNGRASKLVRNWLLTWNSDQTINTFTVAGRTGVNAKLIDPWKQKDGFTGPTADWVPNLDNAPFRLLAIVNRIDLNRGTPARVDSAGEARFVFCAVNAGGAPLPFTLIFEYEMLAKNRAELRGWAQRWRELGTEPFGPAYNAKLEAITRAFSRAGSAPAKGNQNALNQIRTNEIELVLPADFNRGWELREFTIPTGGTGPQPLVPATVKQNPANALNQKPVLADFINTEAAEIIDGTIVMDDTLLGGQAFLGGSSVIGSPPPVGFFWDAPGILNNEARHNFAILTCNGCHHIEAGFPVGPAATDTNMSFTHIRPRAAGQEATLSKFLTGPSVPGFKDPKVATVDRPFVDDLGVRAEILRELAAEPGPSVRLNNLQRSRRARVH